MASAWVSESVCVLVGCRGGSVGGGADRASTGGDGAWGVRHAAVFARHAWRTKILPHAMHFTNPSPKLDPVKRPAPHAARSTPQALSW